MSQPVFDHQPVEDGDVVFDAPWQARTFAMAVKLNEAGVFTWSEWSLRLAKNIQAAESLTEHDTAVVTSDDYYTCWQQTLEMLVREKTGGS
ncbi:MAG: nitrile hydratase accessory protein [Acidiferrobacterales bacterium]|nr:nitrile hydratase accessory protein [Acidiferrobacterales bacterium]